MPTDQNAKNFGTKEEILGRSEMIKMEKKVKKSTRLFGKASASCSKVCKKGKRVTEKKDIEPVTIVSDDDEEEMKVEQKVAQNKEAKKEQKKSKEVSDDHDDELTKEKVFEMIKKPGGVQSIGDLYHNYVSYEQHVIEKAFVKYLVQNNLVVVDVVDCLPEDLIEILIERMAEGEGSDAKEDFIEANLQEKMIEKCKRAHWVPILNLMNFIKYMEAPKVIYKFCLRWSVATHKFKDEIDQIESQLVEMAKNYKIYEDIYGKERDKA